MPSRLAHSAVIASLLLAGCAEPAGDSAKYKGGGERAPRRDAGGVVVAQAQPAAGEAAPAVAADNAGAMAEPRIIYTSQLDLVVKDLAAAADRIQGLVGEHKGYIADGEVSRTQGSYPTGRWVARVPSGRLEDLLAALSEVGVPERRTQSAEDVTEEYVDLEARIENKKRLEERILELLKERDGKIDEIIEVERELGRVREEIERMEGRLRYLQNRTEYATITVTAREEKDYVPPQAPTFTSQIATTWGRSLESLRLFGEGLVIMAVALTPWLPVLLVVLFAVIWLLRRMFRAMRRAVGRV